MRILIHVVSALTLMAPGCGGDGPTRDQERPAAKSTDAPGKARQVDADTAVDIAKKDASQDFRTPDQFKITVSEDAKGWRVIFKPKNPRANGGGPEYVIDRVTGEILGKVIRQ